VGALGRRYPQRALSSRTKTPPPATRTERRSHGKKRRIPLALILVPVVLIGGGVALFLNLTGGGKAIIDKVTGGEEPVPEFAFSLKKVLVTTTAEGSDVEALRPAAEAAADEVAPVLSTLFTEAYLDPNNWKDGAYDEAFELFAPESRSAAESAIDTLTAGANAGDLYENLSERKGSIRVGVLFDREGKANSISAHVRFYALGERKDGGWTSIVSHGVMFLKDTGDGWRVTAYNIKRNDREAEAPAATGATGATSASTGSSGAGGSS
jgi:hypothetical protein